jgi:hypothetical protein
MPGDPKECRKHALNCMLLAKQASTEESKQTFLRLSKSWTRLAAELQDAETFLKTISEIEVSNPPQGEDLSPLTDVSDKERSAEPEKTPIEAEA